MEESVKFSHLKFNSCLFAADRILQPQTKSMKKFYETCHPGSGKWQKFLLVMKIKSFLLLCCVAQVYANASFSQQAKLNVNYKDQTIVSVLDDLKIQTGYTFVYQQNLLSKTARVSTKLDEASLESILDEVLVKNGYDYSIEGKVVVINKAQQQPQTQQPAVKTIKVKGRVTDEKGNALAGVTVIVNQTSRGTATDGSGRYEIDAKPDDVLKFSFIGYKDMIILVDSKTTIHATMQLSEERIEEVTVTAWGAQKKESVVSAITTVNAKDLVSSNSDLTASFAGKIAGIVGWQTGGRPGALLDDELNTQFYIRGISSFQGKANTSPLILIDGVESSRIELSRIAPEDIESFSVLKDATATSMYGARGANGVILVATKKGAEGSVYTSVRYEAIASQPTQEIDVVDPITWMKMYNEALLARDPSATPKYSVERINRTGSSKYPSWLYPANDWYGMMFKDQSINHHLGLNIRGGSKVVQYYASLNYNQDNGMLKTDRLNQFNTNIRNNSTSFRTNMNINLTSGIQLLINSSATIDRYHGPYADVKEAYGMAFSASPVDVSIMYPADDTYNWPHLRFGGLGSKSNPYMALQQGYLERMRYSATNRAEYIQNLGSLVKGLELRASVALQRTGYSCTPYSTKPFQYSLGHYDFETGKHTLSPINNENARRTLQIIKDDGRAASSSNTAMTYDARLMHTAAWGGVDNTMHQSSLTAAFNMQETTSAPQTLLITSFPHRNLGVSMRGTYGFKEKYFAEASFGYNGSERFDKSHRMGFFPAAGLAWIISKESFMAPLDRLFPLLKLRASYGQVGNDGIISSPRFVFLPEVSAIGGYSHPEPNTQTFMRYVINSYANPNITWEVAEQVNFGIDAKMFNGLVEFNVDAYQEIRHNIISYRTTIPTSLGIEKDPLDNIGKVRSRGIDFNGKIQHAFKPDVWVILNGTFTYNKATYLEIVEATDKPVWQRKVGHDISQTVGYIAEGLFRDQAEIANAPFQGDVMPGDIRYRDINDDGVIDVNDATYIGFPTTPRVTYGFSGSFYYKGLEMSFAFQGSGKRTFFLNPAAISPFTNDHAMLTAIYNDHWTVDNVKEKPLWPRLSVNNLIMHNVQEDWYNKANAETRKSTYFMRECTFLRCTSLELSYKLPRKMIERMKLQTVKFYVRANNPFIITDFKVWDVELGESGFNYPIQKTYSVGVNVSF